MTKGTCNCAAVSFGIEGTLKDVYVCHCSICRRWTGTNGVAVIIVPNQSFRWLSGQEHISSWKKPDADWHSWFCSICGSALPGPNDDHTMFIPAGLLDASVTDLRIAAHIWVGSKACWDEIAGSAMQCHESFQN